MEKQNPSFVKRKFGIITPQTPSPDEILEELRKPPEVFDVEKAACWDKFGSVPFMFMANAVDAIAIESNTIVITNILCNMLRTVIETSPGELVAVMCLLSEDFEPRRPFISLAFLRDEIVKLLQKVGESMDVGESLSGVTRKSTLTVVEVYKTFKELNKYRTTETKKELIKKLFVEGTGCEPLNLIRLVQRMIHVGLQVPRLKLPLEEQTLLTALGHAALYSVNLYSPSDIVDNPLLLEKAAKVVNQVYSVVPVYDKLVPDLLIFGVWKLWETCTITPGIPFRSMRASHVTRSRFIHEIFNKFQEGNLICEYSYPGEHALIHYTEKKGLLEVYDTNGSSITRMYLDVARAALSSKKPVVESFILECYLARPCLMEKKKKIEETEESTEDEDMHWSNNTGFGQRSIYASDILYLNGKALLQEQLKVRKKYLRRSFEEKTGVLEFAAVSTPNRPAALQAFFDEAVSFGCSQMLIKTLTEDATYEPGSESQKWMVLEKDMII